MNKKEQKRYEKILGEKKVYEMTPKEKAEPITKEMAELCRHRLEKRWYRRMIELNLLIIVVAVAMFVNSFSKNLELMKGYADDLVQDVKACVEELVADGEECSEEQKEVGEKNSDESKEGNTEQKNFDESKEGNAATKNADKNEKHKKEKNGKKKTKKSINELPDLVPFEVQVLGYGLFLLVVGYLALYLFYAMYRSMSLRITKNNFPEVYRTIEEYSNRLGIAVPKAYVMQTNGVLNAFSTFLFRKQWICIHSELFEVAYREHKDMDALNFVIAHELAHIYYGHATLHYNLPIWFSKQIPLVSAIASRTWEYSCDRLAQRLTGTDGIDAMLMLVVDRHLYKMVDREDYLNEIKTVKGFFVWVYNLFADHPVMSKRVLALYEGRGSGKLY